MHLQRCKLEDAVGINKITNDSDLLLEGGDDTLTPHSAPKEQDLRH